MRTVSRLLVVSFLLAAVLTSTLPAQTFRGTLLGTVSDPTGAVIPGASISVKNMDTGIERTTESNSDGAFTVPELPIGRYSVTVNMTGFNPYQAEGLDVSVGSQVNLNVTLQTGGQKEEVVVSGNALQVETTSNTLGETLTTGDVKNLPVNGRYYTKLIYLTPGVTGSPDQISDSPGSFGAFSVNGARGRSNNFLLGWYRHERRLPQRSGCPMNPGSSARLRRFCPSTQSRNCECCRTMSLNTDEAPAASSIS